MHKYPWEQQIDIDINDFEKFGCSVNLLATRTHSPTEIGAEISKIVNDSNSNINRYNPIMKTLLVNLGLIPNSPGPLDVN